MTISIHVGKGIKIREENQIHVQLDFFLFFFWPVTNWNGMLHSFASVTGSATESNGLHRDVLVVQIVGSDFWFTHKIEMIKA